MGQASSSAASTSGIQTQGNLTVNVPGRGNPWLWVGIAAAALVVVFLVLRKKKR
jgi:hypothetical protein